MTTFVLDSSAILRYVDGDAGSGRVEELLTECAAWKTELSIPAVQWGEIAGGLRKRFGSSREVGMLSALLPSEVTVVPATADRAVRAADLKVDKGISYADAFALDLAMDSPDHVLVTADYGFKDVEGLARIEFLPPK